MNIKKISGMLLLTVFCAVGFTGNAQQVAPLTFNVSVNVACENEAMKVVTESHIKRELRSLGDVHINSQDTLITHALYTTVIENAREVIGKDGTLAMATIFTELLYPYHILKDNLPHQQYMNVMDSLVSQNAFSPVFQDYKQSFLVTGETLDLATFCKNTVAAFDGTVLQKLREKQ